ncbi:MAG: hypothetical protein RL172_706 [Bacteroidota bacterium]|jgi:membrane protein YdbS with pleckstrin-like domain
MNEADAILAEINNSIDFYEQRAAYYRRLYIGLRVIEFLLAFSILPILYFETAIGHSIKLLFLALGITLVLLLFISLMLQPEARYCHCRLQAKNLLTEKHLYLNRAGIYNNNNAPALLVQRFDELRAEQVKQL